MEEKIESIKKHLTEISEELFKKYGTDSYLIRCAIADVKDSVSKLHQPTVISTVRCDHIFLRQDSMWMKCAKCGMVQPISTGL